MEQLGGFTLLITGLILFSSSSTASFNSDKRPTISGAELHEGQNQMSIIEHDMLHKYIKLIKMLE